MKEELKEFGLTENESITYLALVELGASTATPIKNKTGLHTSRVYEALNTLIKKGLVSYFIKNNVKHFQAQDPDVMFDILDAKREQLLKVMPQIKLLSDKKESDYSVSIYEGYKAFKQLFDHILFKLDPSQEILVVGAQHESAHFMNRTFFKEYNQRRINKKVNMRIIFNHDAIDTAKTYAKLPHTFVRIMLKNMVSPTAMNIYPDKMSILLQKEKPLIFHIACKEVAESYKLYFEFLWKAGSKV